MLWWAWEGNLVVRRSRRTLRLRSLVYLVLILWLAFGLRLINLGGRTLWYDEAFAVLFAEKGLSAMREGTLTTAEGSAADVHPLLYYGLLHGWMRAAGQSVVAVRLLSVLLGLLTVAFVCRLAHDWFGERTARAAGAIVAVAPFHVQYSQETRMYALLALTLIASTWACWRGWSRNRAGWWLLLGVLAGVSMYTQQLAAFYLLALGLLPLLYHDRRRMVSMVGAGLVALVIYLPWLVHLPAQMGKLRQYWVERPNILHLWLTLRSFIAINLDFAPTWWLPTFLLAAVLPVFAGLEWRRTRHSLSRASRERLAVDWAMWLALAPMAFMWAASHLLRPVFLPRALLPSAVMFYLALAWLFTRSRLPLAIRAMLAMGWGAVIVFGLVTHYTWDRFPNPPFDRAVAYLRAHLTEGDVVVHGNKITALPMLYYDRDVAQRYIRDIPGSGSDTLAVPTQRVLGALADACVGEAAQGAPRVWYIAFDRLEEEMGELIAEKPDYSRYDALGWLRQHYTLQDMAAFHDLLIYQFVGPDAEAKHAVCD